MMSREGLKFCRGIHKAIVISIFPISTALTMASPLKREILGQKFRLDNCQRSQRHVFTIYTTLLAENAIVLAWRHAMQLREEFQERGGDEGRGGGR